MEKEDKILESGLKLFSEFGFHATPTSKIAKEAGVSNGTLFHYFPTKEILILRLYESIKRELNQAVEQKILSESDLKKTVRIYFEESILWALNNQDKFNYIQQLINSPYYNSIDKQDKTVSGNHLELIELGKKNGELIDLPSPLIFSLISHTVIAVYEYLKENSQDESEIIRKGFEQVWKLIT